MVKHRGAPPLNSLSSEAESCLLGTPPAALAAAGHECVSVSQQHV